MPFTLPGGAVSATQRVRAKGRSIATPRPVINDEG